MKQKISILIIALLLALYAAWPTIAQQTACYGQQGGIKQIAGSGCEYEFQSGSTLDIQSGTTETHANNVTFSGVVTQSGDVAAGDDFTLTGDMILTPQTAITLTDAGVLTPTGTFQKVQAAAGVTVTLATSGYTSGMWLIIENISNVTVVITDTGAVILSSDISLGQYDTAELIFDGTNWVQLGESNN